jgi:hypothetical protein
MPDRSLGFWRLPMVPLQRGACATSEHWAIMGFRNVLLVLLAIDLNQQSSLPRSRPCL